MAETFTLWDKTVLGALFPVLVTTLFIPPSPTRLQGRTLTAQ